jgi:hypothetical protein
MGDVWREGEGFVDYDENGDGIPDSLQSGNVGGHNPDDHFMLLQRLY